MTRKTHQVSGASFRVATVSASVASTYVGTVAETPQTLRAIPSSSVSVAVIESREVADCKKRILGRGGCLICNRPWFSRCQRLFDPCQGASENDLERAALTSKMRAVKIETPRKKLLR